MVPDPALLEGLKPMYPLGRIGESEDIAAAVEFLGSDDAGWITGHTHTRRGWLAYRPQPDRPEPSGRAPQRPFVTARQSADAQDRHKRTLSVV
jgi:hypothetical protein